MMVGPAVRGYPPNPAFDMKFPYAMESDHARNISSFLRGRINHNDNT
jgi:hypothetical protein